MKTEEIRKEMAQTRDNFPFSFGKCVIGALRIVDSNETVASVDIIIVVQMGRDSF